MQVTVIESCILIMFHLIFAREFERGMTERVCGCLIENKEKTLCDQCGKAKTWKCLKREAIVKVWPHRQL